MSNALKSKLFAGALSLGMAITLTVAQSIAAPAPAHAGVIGSIKGAAKSVGGAVKTAAKGVGTAAKLGAGVGKQVAIATGKNLAKLPPVKGVINAGQGIKMVAQGKVKFR
jgi:hypothetical protein